MTLHIPLVKSHIHSQKHAPPPMDLHNPLNNRHSPNHHHYFVSTSKMASPSLNKDVSLEEFKAFHSIDRKLYTRLVTSLGCDPAETMQVMALFLWFEQITNDLHLVSRLLKLPDAILFHVVEEATTVLKVVENDEFPYVLEDANNEIQLLQALILSKNDDVITLRFFHSHRLGVIRGVTNLMNEICVKAFTDIMQMVLEINRQQQFSLFQVSPTSSGMLGNNNNVPYYRPPPGFSTTIPARVRLFNNPSSSSVIAPMPPYDPAIDPLVYIEATTQQPPRDYYLHQLQRNSSTNNADEMGQLLDEVNRVVCTGGEDDQMIRAAVEVPPEERTIFLTFSKGYPITETEVREFFTRRNGDVIDGIHMQEVLSPDEQILYARMVVKTEALVDVILGGKNVKAKFAINGKHVWGRKYVKKTGVATNNTGASSSGSGGSPSRG